MPCIMSPARCGIGCGDGALARCAASGARSHIAGKRAVSASERANSMIVVDVRDMPPEQWRLGVETRMLVSASNGAARLCIFEQCIAPGAGAPTHSHPAEEV